MSSLVDCSVNGDDSGAAPLLARQQYNNVPPSALPISRFTFTTIKNIRDKIAHEESAKNLAQPSSSTSGTESDTAMKPRVTIMAVVPAQQVAELSDTTSFGPRISADVSTHLVELDDDDYYMNRPGGLAASAADVVAHNPDDFGRKVVTGAQLRFRTDVVSFYKFLVATDGNEVPQSAYAPSVAYLQDQCSTLPDDSIDQAASSNILRGYGGQSFVRHLTVVAETYRLLADVPQLLKITSAAGMSALCKEYSDKLDAFRWSDVVRSCGRVLPVLAKKLHVTSTQHPRRQPTFSQDYRFRWETSHRGMHVRTLRGICDDSAVGLVSAFEKHNFTVDDAVAFYVCCCVRRYACQHSTRSGIVTGKSRQFHSSAAPCRGAIDYIRRLCGALWACHIYVRKPAGPLQQSATNRLKTTLQDIFSTFLRVIVLDSVSSSAATSASWDMNSFLFDILLPCMKGVSVSDWADRKPGGLTSRRKSLQVFIARHYDHGCFLLKKEADASKWLVRRAQANLDGDKQILRTDILEAPPCLHFPILALADCRGIFVRCLQESINSGQICYRALCSHLSSVLGGDSTCHKLIVPETFRVCAGGKKCPNLKKRASRKESAPGLGAGLCCCQVIPEIIRRLRTYYLYFPHQVWSAPVENEIERVITTLPQESQGRGLRAAMANIKSVKVSEVALLQRAALRWYSDEDQLCAILYTPLSEIPSLVTHNGATWYDRDALLRHFQGPRSLVDPATNVKWRRKLKAAKLTESAESALAHCYLDVDDLLQKIMSSRSYEDITLPNSAGAPRALDHNVGSFLSSTKMSQCEAQPQCKDKLLQVARERLAQMEDTKTRRAVLAFAIKRAGRILRQSATQQGSAGHSAAQSQRQRSKAKIDSMDFSVILETKALCVLFDPAGNALLTAEDAKPIESAEKESFSSLSCKASVKNGAEGSSIARVRNVKKEHFFTDRKLANKKKKMKRVREECRMRQAKKQELLFPGSSNSSCSRSSSSSSAQPQMKRADNGQAHGSAGSAQEESGGHARKKPRLE